MHQLHYIIVLELFQSTHRFFNDMLNKELLRDEVLPEGRVRLPEETMVSPVWDDSSVSNRDIKDFDAQADKDAA